MTEQSSQKAIDAIKCPDCVALQSSLAKATAMLKRLEWIIDEQYCPCCDVGERRHYHTQDCELGKLIQELDK